MERRTQENFLLVQSCWCRQVSVRTKARDQVKAADLCNERKFYYSTILIKYTHAHTMF